MFPKSLENFERIQRLVSLRPPMCHNTDTMWHTENRIPRYKPQTTTKSIPKFSALRLKRSSQDTGYGDRKHAKLRTVRLVLGLLQVVGTVKTRCRNKPVSTVYPNCKFGCILNFTVIETHR